MVYNFKPLVAIMGFPLVINSSILFLFLYLFLFYESFYPKTISREQSNMNFFLRSVSWFRLSQPKQSDKDIYISIFRS